MLVALVMTSCGGPDIKPEKKDIKGDIKGFFEVVDKEYAVNGDGEVNIEFKRVKEGMPGKWKKDMELGTFTPNGNKYELTLTVEFKDQDGNVLGKEKAQLPKAKEDLEALVALGVDETSSVKFKAPENAATFTVSSTFKCGAARPEALNLTGVVGKYPINMHMEISSTGEITGAYYYKSMGPGNPLFIKGQMNDDGQFSMNEFTRDGFNSGSFTGKYNAETNTVTGNMTNSKGQNFSLNFSVDDGIPQPQYSDVNFNIFNPDPIDFSMDAGDYSMDADDYEISDVEGDSSIDDLLDAYERYCDKMVAFAKKAKNGDVTVLAEYGDVVKEAQQYAKKLEKVQGQMSMAQAQRLNRIAQKYAKALQEMQ